METVYVCGDCGSYFLKEQGKVFQDSKTHISFACNVCLNKPEYKITITFKADRPLTSYELNALEGNLMLQIDEPTNADQENEDYATSNANYKTERIK
jgi:hypothetical protein